MGVTGVTFGSASPDVPVTGLHKMYLDHGRKVQSRRLGAQSNPDGPAIGASCVPMVDSSTGPDIEWYPSLETYKARVARLAKTCVNRPKEVPENYPTMTEKPWVWSGQDLKPEQYIFQLTDSDILEINAALGYYKRYLNADLSNVTQETFPLPTLGLKLGKLALNIHNGTGFNIIRGLNPSTYDAKDNMIIYLGITSYVAEKRGCQNSSGDMIIHIKDLGDDVPNSELRQSPYANNAQPFHNDMCDILAMYVQEQAVSGGESHLASSGQVYNEIAAGRPDVIHTLAKDNWTFDKHGFKPKWNTRALLFNFKQHGPGFVFSRRPITGSPTSPHGPGVPKMTEIQAEAIDMVHFTAWKHKLTLTLQRGDIQLINNLAIQHARNHFVDGEHQKRHVVRLWLRNEKLAWETPDGLKKSWEEKYGDSARRQNMSWNVFPGAPREKILFKSDSCS